jgi:hypothetical protein
MSIDVKIGDGSGTGREAEISPFGELLTCPRASDFMYAIAAGQIPGHSVVNKFGANETVGSGTQEDVWDGGGTYSYPATALMTSMSQTADQATMRGGVIQLQGLDANWDLVIQTKALNTADTRTAVTLDTPMIRCFRMKVFEDVVTTSPIRCHNVGETIDYAIISTGNNQTLMAIYTVPRSKTAYMTNYYCDGIEATGKDPTSVVFKLWAADRKAGHAFQLKHVRGVNKGTPGTVHDFAPNFKLTQKTDIKMSAQPDDKDAYCTAGFDIILVDN